MNATLVLASLLTLSTRQDAPKPLTFETAGTTVAKALESISKSAGVNWKAAPQTAPDIVVLRFENAALGEVKEKLARAVSGKWETQTDGTELLVADENQRRDEQRADESAYIESLKKGLQSMAKALEPPKKPEKRVVDGEEVEEESYEASAGHKLLARLVSAIRLSDISSLKPGERTVFSTNPTAMQRAIRPQGLDQAIAEYVKFHNDVYGNTGGVETGPVDEGGMTDADRKQAMDLMKQLGYEEPKQPGKIQTAVAKVLLVVERSDSSRGDSVQVGYRLFDPSGKCLATQQMSLGGWDYMEAVPASSSVQDTKEPPAKPVDPDLNVPFKPSDEVVELIKSMNPMGGGEPKDVSDALRAKLARPDEYEPLSYIAGQQILAIATAKKANLAACVPDEIAETGMTPMGEGTLAAIKEGLERETKWEAATGWIVVRPDAPAKSRAHRLDRVALAQFLAKCAGRDVPTLDMIADYAAKNEPLVESPAAMPGVFFVCPGAFRIVMTYQASWDMLRLYGLLSPGTRQSLKQGQPVSIGAMGGPVSAQVRKMVYGTGADFTTSPTDPNRPRGLFVGMGMGMRGDGQIEDFRHEPTEFMPNGLPGNATLTVRSAQSSYVAPTDTKGFFAKFLNGLGPEDLGMLWSFSDMPNGAEFASMFPKATKFKVGSREELTFSINLVQGVRQIHYLQEDTMPKDAAEVTKDQLPKDFLERAQMMADLMKKGFGQFMRGVPGGAVPPR
ncbi:MAG: hypothetical protein JST30_07460 [Armatimonadetes bacterium]|nr:hypothetical protein [Armatimonadota bacterium]